MKTYHVTIKIETVLAWNDQKLGELFSGNGEEIRKELEERKAEGQIYILSEGCDGCFINGCPGHEVKDRAYYAKKGLQPKKALLIIAMLLIGLSAAAQIEYKRVKSFSIGNNKFKLHCAESDKPDTLYINGKMFTILSTSAERGAFSKEGKWLYSTEDWIVTNRSDRVLTGEYWQDEFIAYFNRSKTKIIKIERGFYGRIVKTWN